MGCLNSTTREDLLDLDEALRVFDAERLFSDSTLQLSETQIAGIRHVSADWGSAQMSGAKGGVLEQIIVDRLEANRDVLLLSAHPDNPNLHGHDVVVFDRPSGTVCVIEAKNWTSRVGANRTSTLHKPIDEARLWDQMVVADVQREAPAVLSALARGHVAKLIVTGPHCDAAPQSGVENVDFDRLVGVA